MNLHTDMGGMFSFPMKFDGTTVRRIAIGNSQHPGARPYQEDSFGYTPLSKASGSSYGFMAVVADGMGGMSCGDKVSGYTVSSMLEMRNQIDDMTPVNIRFTQMLRTINNAVLDGGTGGGTTVAAVFCCHKGAYLCTLGDSRIYLFRNGMLFLMSEDTDYFNELLDDVISGELDYDDAADDPQKDSLAQYIGADRTITPDVTVHPLIPETGDKLLICSDGVYNALKVGELSTALAEDAQTAADKIMQNVLSKGYPNQDNFTSVILQFI